MTDGTGAATASAAEIAPGVHRINTVLGERISSLYLFVGRDRALLFDAGVDGEIPRSVLPYAEQIGLDLARIEKVVISHCDVDHFGGAADVAEYLAGATLVAHEQDADAIEDFTVFERERGRSFRKVYGLDEDADLMAWMRSVVGEAPVGERLTGDTCVDLGDRELRILHTPGHSKGHLSIFDAANSLVAISDAVLGDAVPLANGDAAFPPTYRFVEEYLATIGRLLELQPATLATAHYGVYSGAGVPEFLELSRDFAVRLRSAVHEAVAASPGITLAALLAELNPRVGAWPAAGTVKALAFPVVGHIEQLVAEGVLTVLPSEGAARIEVAR